MECTSLFKVKYTNIEDIDEQQFSKPRFIVPIDSVIVIVVTLLFAFVGLMGMTTLSVVGYEPKELSIQESEIIRMTFYCVRYIVLALVFLFLSL